MEIYLVRHGIAVGREADMPDALRPLTEKGRRRFRKTARAFARLGRKVDLILTSPLVRAVQTAEILAAEARHGDVTVLEELDPKFGVRSLLDAVAKRADGIRSVALVGHDPQLSSALATLAGLPAELLDFRKGAIVRLVTEDVAQAGSAEARWSLKPRSKTARKGPPLAKAQNEDAEEPAPKRRAKRTKRSRSERRRPSRAAKPAETSVSAEEGSADETSAHPEIAEAGAAAEVTEPGERGIETPSAPTDSVPQSGSDSSAHPV
jgi:phosphohistidine phosphatase